MTGRRVIVGLCMLCALMISAVAAQSASAESTTAVTCKKPVGEDKVVGATTFAKEHCTKADGEVGGEFKHVEIPNGTSTSITGSNVTTGSETEPTLLHSVQSGIEEELKATEVTGSGSMENGITGGGEMFAKGKGVITYKGVTVVKPSGKGCTVKGGEVVTNELEATTEGQAKQLKFVPVPAAKEVFAVFTVEGCTQTVLNGVYEVKGSITSTEIDGATTRFDRTLTTGQKTLKVRGQNAGLEGLLTIKGNGIPLSVT